MVATKNLGLAGLLWLGLASKGLALEIDQNNELTLVERAELLGEVPVLDTRNMHIQIVPNPSTHTREAEELDERDLEELDERDLEELDERDLEELDERDWEDIEERDFDDLVARNLGSIFKKVAKGALSAGDIISKNQGKSYNRANAAAMSAMKVAQTEKKQEGKKRDMEAIEFETRAIPGQDPSSWGNQGRRGHKKQENHKSQAELNIPGKDRASWGNQGKKKPAEKKPAGKKRDVEAIEFETRTIPGQDPSSWGNQGRRGHKKQENHKSQAELNIPGKDRASWGNRGKKPAGIKRDVQGIKYFRGGGRRLH